MARESFILYKSFREPLEHLSLENMGRVLMAIFEYVENGNTMDMPLDAKMAFLFIKKQIDLDAKKYQETCEERITAGRKGAAKRWANKGVSSKNSKCHTMNSKNSKCQNEMAKMAVYDTEYENDDDNDTNDNNKLLSLEKNKQKNSVGSLVVRAGNWNPVNEDVLIDGDFDFDFTDPVFSTYIKVPDDIKQSVRVWLRREKANKIVSKRFIVEQFTNFARRQGKLNELLRAV